MAPNELQGKDAICLRMERPLERLGTSGTLRRSETLAVENDC